MSIPTHNKFVHGEPFFGEPTVEVDDDAPNKKIVFVGDTGVGKTSIVLALRNHRLIEGNVPSIFQSAFKEIYVEPGVSAKCFLCDTLGNDYANLAGGILDQHRRPNAYKDAHVVAICFSVADRKSFENVKQKWIVEVREHFKGKPVVLVATKTDLRGKGGVKGVTEDEAMDLAAEIDAADYVEISALECDEDVITEVERTVAAAALSVRDSFCIVM
ncbi:P-loop containing nucleoside triphosphate hydrolase protein [Cladochytrium replicatum]|nr:P-loop containing nucleoside triphosphate hydrolase protein [Cladochytrium replicatum]